MPRPRSGRTGRNITLYLDQKTLEAAQKHAFRRNTSLSDLVNRLLVAELNTRGGLAHQHPRRIGAMA